MLLWRLSGTQFARAFDGGYGLNYPGRWNTIGHAVTYCSTSPSLCVLEKLVHIEDPALLPELVMITYEASDHLPSESVELNTLPGDWRRQESLTQQLGDTWHRSRRVPLLKVPSAIVPFSRSPDINILINHSHASSASIKLLAVAPFVFDPRLL